MWTVKILKTIVWTENIASVFGAKTPFSIPDKCGRGHNESAYTKIDIFYTCNLFLKTPCQHLVNGIEISYMHIRFIILNLRIEWFNLTCEIVTKLLDSTTHQFHCFLLLSFDYALIVTCCFTG